LEYKYSNFSQSIHTSYLPAYEDGIGSVPKRRHIKFRRCEINQKKAYDIQNKAKVCLSHLHKQVPAYEDGTVFRNVDISNSDAGVLPRRKHTIFRTRRKFEIKNYENSLCHNFSTQILINRGFNILEYQLIRTRVSE